MHSPSQSINAFLEDIGEVMKGFYLGCIVIAGGAIGWATAQARQPAGQASAPSLFHVSAKGDHQALGCGR